MACYDTLTGNGSTSTVLTLLNYDNAGRLSSAQATSGSTQTTSYFTYGAGLIVVTSGGGQVDSVYLNSNGLPDRSVDTENGETITLITIYDANKHPQSINEIQDISGTNYVLNFVNTITNGDVTLDKSNLGDSTVFTYYTDKPANNADWYNFDAYLEMGVALSGNNTHLVASLQTTSLLENYTYSFDDKGNLVHAVSIYGSNVHSRGFEYDCSQ